MSVKTDVVLGIDIGTTSSKAVARPVSPRATPECRAAHRVCRAADPVAHG